MTPTMTIKQRSAEVCYVTIENQFGKYTFYIDNSTGEQIMKCWNEEEDAIKTIKEIWNS
jgi:hypothetical protein